MTLTVTLSCHVERLLKSADRKLESCVDLRKVSLTSPKRMTLAD